MTKADLREKVLDTFATFDELSVQAKDAHDKWHEAIKDSDKHNLGLLDDKNLFSKAELDTLMHNYSTAIEIMADFSECFRNWASLAYARHHGTEAVQLVELLSKLFADKQDNERS